MSDAWHEVCERIDDADFEALGAVLGGLDAAGRAELAPLLDGHVPATAEPEPVVVPPPEPRATFSLSLSHVITAADQLVDAADLLAAQDPTTTAADRPPAHDLEALRAARDRRRRLQAGLQGGLQSGLHGGLQGGLPGGLPGVRTRSGGVGRAVDVWHLERMAREAADRRNGLRRAALGMAVIACLPTAGDAVRRLHRPAAAGPPLRLPPEAVPGLLRARGTAWCATLARGMARRVATRTRTGQWPFTEALLRAVAAGPPDTPGAVAQYVAMWRGSPLAPILAADPWFDAVLPFVFDDDRVAAAFVTRIAGRDWPPALLQLATTGRITRATLIAGCLRRLRAGGRKGLLRPYLTLLTRLAPDPGELAGHRQELTGLLAAESSTVAGFAYTALRDLHEHAPLDQATRAEITLSMLCRPERTLVRAHLGWLRRQPLDPVVEGLAAGLHHPVPELAAGTLDLIEGRWSVLSAATRERLGSELPALTGAAGDRLAALCGAPPPAPPPVPVLVADLPAAMPPPLDLSDLAGELAIAVRPGRTDPVRHELVLAGLLRAARGDRAAAARVLGPLIPQWPGLWQDLVASATGAHPPIPAQRPAPPSSERPGERPTGLVPGQPTGREAGSFARSHAGEQAGLLAGRRIGPHAGTPAGSHAGSHAGEEAGLLTGQHIGLHAGTPAGTHASEEAGLLAGQHIGPFTGQSVGAHAGLPSGQPAGRVAGSRPGGPVLPAPAAIVRWRVVELAFQLAAGPPPALLATPATVAGHVDPERVAGLLLAAERDGWQPGAADLTQALLRLPREVDPAVHAAAARLASPAGRRFAAWLAGVAEPRTWVEEVADRRHSTGWRVAMLHPAGLPADLADPRPAAERSRTGWNTPDLALWPMVTPSHREVAAAHLQPYVAATVDRGNPGTVFLDGLAAADGPPGPAAALTLALAMASHREPVRLAAADALIALAGRPGWVSTGVGEELGALAAAGLIVTRRVVQPLTEALKAGAHDAVWQVTSAALPALLAADPRPGLADLVSLAAAAARAGRHTADLPGLAALTAGPHRNRLTAAARDLAALMPAGG